MMSFLSDEKISILQRWTVVVMPNMMTFKLTKAMHENQITSTKYYKSAKPTDSLGRTCTHPV